jgi:guanylate kinase
MSSENPELQLPILFVVSSPSGAGKTTLTRRLLNEFSGRLRFSISYTTRPPRTGERDGVDYHFVDEARFEKMVAAEEFAEWAVVHGNRYGTSVETIRRSRAEGFDVIFDIDYQGGRQLKAKYPADAVMVFVLPPDMDTLASRLRSRATDAEAVIARRLQKAVLELGHYHAYEHLVVNDDLERAYAELRAIFIAAHTRWDRRSRIAERLIREAQRPEIQAKMGLKADPAART